MARERKLTFTRLYRENFREDFPKEYKDFIWFKPYDYMAIEVWNENGEVFIYNAEKKTLTKTERRWHHHGIDEKNDSQSD